MARAMASMEACEREWRCVGRGGKRAVVSKRAADAKGGGAALIGDCGEIKGS